MVIQVVGKANFHSEKKGKDYYTLHCVFQRDGVEGSAVEVKFVSAEIYNSVQVGCLYSIVYGAYDNGRAYISELREVKRA